METIAEVPTPLIDKGKLEEDFIQECRKVFSLFDFDDAGTITVFKLERVMQNLGWCPTRDEVQVCVK